MSIAPVGTTNLAAIGVPNVIVQVVPPAPVLNGVPTNKIAVVGIGSWGAVNSPVTVGTIQEQISTFGSPLNATYDMGTQVWNAIQQGGSNFVCVRVTDGTDVPSISTVKDSVGANGVILNALYTGTVGNTLNASISSGSNSISSALTYKLSVWLAGGVPESFDNIGGSGATFWNNLISAVNLGQGPQRGPSQLVQAGLSGTINTVTVTVPGSYATLPTASATIGSGATFALHMQAVSATLAAAGSGYVVGDTITLAGSTGTEPVITVDAVSTGAITAFHISTPGNATVLGSNPVSQGTTTGIGTGAEFNLLWGLLSVTVSAPGTGYTLNSELVLTGGGSTGGGVGTIAISSTASTNPPSLVNNPYTFSGGTNGNSGVTDLTLIGSDLSPRSGMYALRNSQASIGVLADQTNPTYWPSQISFGLSEGVYMIGTMANGYENNINGAVALRSSNNIASYAFKLMLGDWCQINDPFNNVFRFTSPQGFVAGVKATQAPSNSTLNKIINGIVATQKTVDQATYSNADLLQLQGAGIDVITTPIPASQTAYGVRLGINTSGNVTTIGDNYTTMVNFLAETFSQGLGGFIGLPQTLDVQNQARATLQGFLQNIQDIGWIGTLNGSPAYSVVLDSTNNPPQSVALGYMQANIQVTLFSIIFQFIVNLQAGQSVNVTVLPPQLI